MLTAFRAYITYKYCFHKVGLGQIENKFQDLLPFGILSSLLPRWDENENTFWYLANFLKQFLGPVLWIWSPWFSDDGLMTWMHFRPTKNFCWVRLRGYIQLFFSSRSALQGLSISDGLGKNLGNEPISALLSDFFA